MTSRRVQKAAEAVREAVSWAILTELGDPRVHDVTVTHVEMSGDLRLAKVHVSIMGSEAKQGAVLRGLQHAAGFLQSKLADRIDTRYTPRIEFLLDLGVKKSIEVARILREVLPPPEVEEGLDADDAETPDASASELDANETEANPTPPDR